ncbi:hypothetical protein HHI36_001106 [Cryptolaemus montrouzieri]|uniref:Uncharacterized protein n=1 Tax=Cryptolaemus montrouzieri TaxID=559131 RepID=A0ABD2P6P2_9CUCU
MKKTAWRKYLSLKTLEAHEEYKIQRKKVKELVIKSKQMSWRKFGNRMENARAGNQKLFFRMLKTLEGDKKDITIEINDKQERTLTEENDNKHKWTEYFVKILSTDENQTIQRETTEDYYDNNEQEHITITEVSEDIKKMKNGRLQDMIVSGQKCLNLWEKKEYLH